MKKHTEEIIWGAFVLSLLYATAIITVKLYDTKVQEVYESPCTEIHKLPNSLSRCDE